MAKSKSIVKKAQTKSEKTVSEDAVFAAPEKVLDQRQMQQKYMEMQILDAQVKQIQKQLVALDSQMEEIRDVLDYLNELKGMEIGKELFVPITQGVFIKAELKEKDKVLMNVGSNVVVSKTIEEGKELISKQLKEVEKVREHMLFEFQKLASKSEQLEQELMKLIS